MRNSSFLAVLLGALSAAVPACAADTTAADLSRIEAETLVLKARARQLEVKAQIAAKRGEIANKEAESERLTKVAAQGDPVLRAVEGIGSSIYATLELSNGSTLDVTAGDVLPNGMKVVSIRPNEVIVLAEKKRLRLGTGAPAQPTAAAPAQAPSPVLPPLPMPLPGWNGRSK